MFKLKTIVPACSLALAAMFGSAPAQAQISGDVIRIETPGGGGYGEPPRER